MVFRLRGERVLQANQDDRRQVSLRGNSRAKTPAFSKLSAAKTSGTAPDVLAVGESESGMVTAEMAFASIFAAGFLVVVAWVISLLMLLVNCQNAAYEVARQEARGDAPAAEQARSSGPDGAEFTVTRLGDLVDVQVDLQAKPWVQWLPEVPMSVHARVRVESG